jgi:CheY-like chemotaxis protein
MLAEILAAMAARIDIAENGAAALERIESSRYDLVISDLRMPELDGPGLFRRLKERGEGLDSRILFITGDTLHRNLELFLETTGAPIIEKPFHPRDIRRKVGDMLEGLGQELSDEVRSPPAEARRPGSPGRGGDAAIVSLRPAPTGDPYGENS